MHRYQNIRIKAFSKSSGKKQYYSQIRYPDVPLSSTDLYIKTKMGDRLDLLADEYYDDERMWWVISISNPDIIRKDSYYLKPGLEIRIPSNINQIIKDFEKVNKSY